MGFRGAKSLERADPVQDSEKMTSQREREFAGFGGIWISRNDLGGKEEKTLPRKRLNGWPKL